MERLKKEPTVMIFVSLVKAFLFGNNLGNKKLEERIYYVIK